MKGSNQVRVIDDGSLRRCFIYGKVGSITQSVLKCYVGGKAGTWRTESNKIVHSLATITGILRQSIHTIISALGIHSGYHSSQLQFQIHYHHANADSTHSRSRSHPTGNSSHAAPATNRRG